MFYYGLDQIRIAKSKVNIGRRIIGWPPFILCWMVWCFHVMVFLLVDKIDQRGLTSVS